MENDPTIFSKFISGEKPCVKLYEDELTFAFLDQHPLTKGHALVIPKQPIDHLDDCPEELYQAIFAVVHKISKQLRTAFQPTRVALVVHGYEVPHAHVHIVPMYHDDKLKLAHQPRLTMTEQELQAIAKQLEEVT